MEEKTTQLIPDYVHKIPLPLSAKGKIIFSVFPKKVIDYALRELQSFTKTDPEEQVRYLYGICKTYSQRYNIPINYEWASQLQQKYNIPFNAKLSQEIPSHEMVDNYKSQAQSFAEAAVQQNPQKGERACNHTTENPYSYETENIYNKIERLNREEMQRIGVNMENYEKLKQQYREKRQQQRAEYRKFIS